MSEKKESVETVTHVPVEEMYEYDVVVVGGGPIGLSTAYNCAKAGKSVLVLEQDVLFNESGSSNDLTRMFRTMYTEDYMAKLAKETISLWKDLEDDAGEGALIWMTGLLNFGDKEYKAGPEGGLLDPIKNLNALNMTYKELTAKQIMETYPFQNLREDFVGLFAPDNGCINVPLTLRSLYKLCLQYGAKVWPYAKAEKIELINEGSEVKVYVSVGGKDKSESAKVSRNVKAKKVALTCGAYVNEVLNSSFELELNLDIWEMIYSYFSVDPGPNGTVFPSMWFQFLGDEDSDPNKCNLFYGFPALPWGPPNCCRIAIDNAVNRIEDPKERKTNPSRYDIDRTRAFVKKHIRGASDRPNFTGSCLQTNVYDNMFVLDYLPKKIGKGHENIAVFTAGWAMKFVPLIGKILKELLLDGKTEYDISHFKIDRSDGDQSIIKKKEEEVYKKDDEEKEARAMVSSIAKRVRRRRGGPKRGGSSIRKETLILNPSNIKTYSRDHYIRHLFEHTLKTNKNFSLCSPLGTTPSKEPLKVGIVGAGMAGLYAALLLQDLGIEYEMFEANHRAGGRIFTYRFNQEEFKTAKPSEPAYFDYFDVGAMRIPNTEMMDRVIGNYDWSLVKYLNKNAPKEHRPKLIKYHFSWGNTRMHFNNQNITKDQYDKDFALDPLHFGVHHGGTIADEYVVKGHDHWLNEAYDSFKEEMNQNVGAAFQNLLEYDNYSTRGYLASQEKYPEDVINWLETMDSGTGLYNMAFSESVLDSFTFDNASKDSTERKPPWYCVKGGSERLVDSMLSVLSTKPLLNHTVSKIAPTSLDHGIELTWEDTKEGKKSASSFRHVICTLPLSVLRSIDTYSCNFHYKKRVAMRSLLYDHSAKVGIRFTRRWWQEDFQIIGGQSSTDLPIRTVVYPSYGSELKDAPGVLIASYTWSQDAARIGSMKPSEVVELCLDNLERIHGKVVRETYTGQYFVHDWYHDSYAQGAFALFGPGQFASLFPCMIKTEVNGHLHFAGEATSVHHAWIVGALNSAYRSIVEILKKENRTDLFDKLVKNWGEIPEVSAILEYL